MVQSLTRAMEILEHLRDSDKSCSLAELVQRSGLPPSTVHRILQTFCVGNYVVHDERTHLYTLGPALIPLGMAATKRLKLREAARPILKQLMRDTGEDSFLIIISDYKGLVLEKVDGPSNLKIIERYGSEIDLHCGAMRKCLLAFQSDEFIQKYIDHGLRKHTDSTIVDPDNLLNSLAKIREEGIAVSYGEYIDDALGVGAPVFDRNGKAVAAIGIIAPMSRTELHKTQLFQEAVRRQAGELSQLLGNARRR